MMKINSIILIFLLLSITVWGQLDAKRYHEKRFPSVTANIDVTYGSAPQWIWPYWNETLKMNIYRPTGDTLTRRPLLIFAHAGGFLNGSKSVDDMVALCDSFGQKGYVTATIDYRKGFNPLDGSSCERAVYRGIQDGKAAVRFFKQNAENYGIDTNFIYFGGMSAGGFIALHVGYMDLESERPSSTYGGGTVNDLGCLDCSGNTFIHTSKVRGILDYWGAMQDTTMITSGNVPCLVMHGQNDGTVPHDTGHPFGVSTIPVTMGGGPIFQRLQNMGIYSEYYTSQGPLHMLDGSDNGTFPSSGPNSYWSDTLLPRTRDFLIKTMKPHTEKLVSDTLYACIGVETEFKVLMEQVNYRTQWSYSQNNISYSNTSVPGRLRIAYAATGTYPISAIVFNEVLCASDTVHFTLVIEDLSPFSIISTDLGANILGFSTNPVTAVQWTINGIDYGVSETFTYTANVTESINVNAYSISSNGVCTQERSLLIDHNGLSISAFENEEIKVFPNPFLSEITIETNEPIHVHIYDISGRQIWESKLESPTLLQTESWPSGMYLVRINTDTSYFTTRITK